MSREAVAQARRTFDAFNRGDVDAFVDGFDPEIEWHFNPAFLDRAGTVVRGHDAMRRYFVNDIQGMWREYHAEPEEIHDLGSHLFIVVRFRGAGLQSGVAVDMRLYELYTLRGEVPVRRESFTERDHALAAIGRVGLYVPEGSSRSM